MNTKSVFASTVASLMVAGHVTAGELRIAIPAHTPTTHNINLRFTAESLELQKLRDGVWGFIFKDDAVTDARLVITVENPPVGYRIDTWIFDIPYYWQGSARRELAVAMSNDQTNDPSTRAFLSEARLTPMRVASVAQLALLNQRARKIFVDRYGRVTGGHRSPEKDDVSVAYWLLLSSRELMEKTGFAPDDITELAATWISGIADDPAKADRLLATDTVPRTEAIDLVASLQRREQILTERIVRQISEHIKSTRTRDNGCARAAGLKSHFDSLDEEALQRKDPTLRYSLETAVNVVLCAARKLQATGISGSDDGMDLADARILHEDLVRAIAHMEETRREPSLRERASKHAAEFLALVQAVESQTAEKSAPSG